MSALNWPTVEDSSLKRWERYVGQEVIKLANKTCIEAIMEEKENTVPSKKKEFKYWSCFIRVN